MNQSSNWPLPTDGKRFFIPIELQTRLSCSALAKDLFPSGFGYYPKAEDHRMHRSQHEDNLLIYCASGEGFLSTPAEEKAITAGDLIILPSGTSHYYESSKDNPWSIYWVHFEGQLAKEYLQLINQFSPTPASAYCTASIGQKPEFIQIFQQILATADDVYSFARLLHACQLLKQLITLIHLSLETDKQGNSSLDINTVHHFFSLNINKKLVLEELAQEFNLSRFHFNRLYKKLTGKPPIQYFTELKIKYTCELLDTSTYNIEQIALKAGYTDPDYFSRVFKKTLGLSPRQYRLRNL